jgi:hypothetical protein
MIIALKIISLILGFSLGLFFFIGAIAVLIRRESILWLLILAATSALFTCMSIDYFVC